MIAPTGDRLNHDIRQRCHATKTTAASRAVAKAFFEPMRRDRRLSAIACVSSTTAPFRDNLTH
jgi:hypothetical protein